MIHCWPCWGHLFLASGEVPLAHRRQQSRSIGRYSRWSGASRSGSMCLVVFALRAGGSCTSQTPCPCSRAFA
eukprot:11497766-Alexandrium_andersonii.AAC.1